MRFAVVKGHAMVYDPIAKEKKAIKGLIKEMFGDHKIFIHPRISFVFHMPIPASTPKKLMCMYQSGRFKHEKKFDVDNMIKAYLDCLDSIAFDGDQCVMLGPCIKLYHPEPKTIIEIQERDQVLCEDEIDKGLWEYLNIS
jgi:Holliday junction resolvase RusA-like endonuclease